MTAVMLTAEETVDTCFALAGKEAVLQMGTQFHMFKMAPQETRL